MNLSPSVWKWAASAALVMLFVFAAPASPARAEEPGPPPPPQAPPLSAAGLHPPGNLPPPPRGPRTLPFREGQPIPAGYRVALEPKDRSLMIGGITLFAGFYALSLMIAAATMQNQGDFKLLFIPVGGPFIVAAGLRGCEVCTAMRVPMILDGLLQTAGATMFAVAVSSGGEKILKRNDVARATPRVSLGPASASLRWTF